MVSKIIDNLILNKIIPNEDRDIYEYGLTQLPHLLLNIIFALIVGLLFDLLIETLFFEILYINIRSYSGGYHAKTRRNCTIISFAILILSCLLTNFFIRVKIHNKFVLLLIIGIFNSMFIYRLSPVQAQNKPLSMEDIAQIRKKLFDKIIICNILFTVFALFKNIITFTISITYFIILVLILLDFLFKTLKLSKY